MIAAVRPLLLAFAVLTGTIACVLLDPVPELQKPVRRAPAVVENSMHPSNARPLLELPTEFRIQVRVADPGQGFVWAFFVAAIVAIPIAAWYGRFDLFAAFTVLVLAEVAVLVFNRLRCPLTGIAARFTEDRRENFDIYLPLWLARYNKQIFGTLFFAGIVFTWAMWRSS